MFLFRSPLRLTAQDVYCSTILARGPAARPRCIPPAFGAPVALSPLPHHQNVPPFYHSQASGCCITSQESVPAAPDTPMTRAAFHSPLDPSTKGRIQLSLWKPIDQPYADWMHAIVSVDGSRPAFRLLDFKQGFRPLLHDQGTSLDAFPLCPSASPHPGRCPDPTQPSYPAVCFIYDCFLLSLICGIFLVVLIREEG